MTPASRHATGRVRRHIDQMRRFCREYTSGLRPEDLRGLFDRDAATAYQVLTRERVGEDEPEGRARRVLHRARLLFLGLTDKLSPARRVLFAAAMLLALLGLIGFSPPVVGEPFLLDASRLWFSLSIASLTFLLALELVDRVRVRDELEVARELQSALLPRHAPQLSGYCLAHAYRSANEVGGDYYDFTRLADGRLALSVGDASGHGMAAGLLMAITNASFKLALEIDPTPQRALDLLNRVLCRTGDRRAFVSIFYGLLDPASGRLDFVNAGHPFPLLRRADGSIVELGEGGFPLGLRQDLALSPGSVTLMAGDLLLMYSDGLPEAPNRLQNDFGYERLERLLEGGGAAHEILFRVEQALDRHLAGEPLQDDLSLVVLERLA